MNADAWPRGFQYEQRPAFSPPSIRRRAAPHMRTDRVVKTDPNNAALTSGSGEYGVTSPHGPPATLHQWKQIKRDVGA
ncbi:unnamed protein product, partial [Iphiclides podalirius]